MLSLKDSVQFSCSVKSSSFSPHGLQHARLLCPSLSSRACSNSCPSSQWCHPTISASVILFSSCLQSFPASGSFPRSQFFASGDHRIVASASASVLPMNIRISLQSKGLSRVFSNATVQKHRFFDAQPSLQSKSHTRTWLLKAYLGVWLLGTWLDDIFSGSQADSLELAWTPPFPLPCPLHGSHPGDSRGLSLPPSSLPPS